MLAAACFALPAAGSAQTDEGAAAPQLRRLVVLGELRVVSYYPADAGWTRMWEPWRIARLTADLRRLRSLNANTVRIVVSPRLFGYPEPERRFLERLRELVSIAAGEARDLRFNGGFEQEAQAVDGTALPASWSVLPARHLVVARDRTRRRTGAASVRLESVAPGAGSGLLTIEPVDGGVRADRRAEVTAWVSGGQASEKLRLALGGSTAICGGSAGRRPACR